AVLCDPGQLSALFTALLDNSLKFRGAARPEIRISAFRDQDCWQFRFIDNGIGIEPKDSEAVFYLFKRLNGDRYPGAGIGLAMARRVVETHGGRIWLRSARGHGTQFHFPLPHAE